MIKSWASILSGALKLFNALAGIFRDKQLMRAGGAEVTSSLAEEQQRKVRNANRAGIAARNVDRVPDNALRD